MCFLCVHDVFWCVLCVWAKLPEIKLDDDDDDNQFEIFVTFHILQGEVATF